MKISRKELRQMILESLILEDLSKEDLIQQLVRGDKALDINKFDKANPLIKNIIRKGITGSSGTVRTGQEAVAYLAHEIFPKVLKAQGITPGSAQSVKFTLQFLEEFGGPGLATELAKILPNSGAPNYLTKILANKPGPMALKVIARIGGVDDVVRGVEAAGGLTKPANEVAIALNTAISRPPRVKIPAAEIASILKQIDTNGIAKAAAKEAIKDTAQLGTSTSANTAFKEVAEEAAKKGTKFAKFLRVLGPVGLMVNVLDAFYAPYNLFANGEFMGFKLGLGVSDMATPWGQLTYRRKKLKNPPAKPSDFNKEYKNLIAGLIWNQTKDPTAKEFVTTAIKEDLIDLPAWKEYLAPWREGEKNLIAAAEEFAREEGDEGGGELIDGVDLSKLKATAEDASSAKTNDEKGASKQPSAQKSGWERYIEKTLDKNRAREISKIWAEVSNLPLINAGSDFAGFVAWYKKTKADGKTMGVLNKQAGDDFTPEEALKLIDAADNAQQVRENFGKSHGTLIRERYWGRY